ncbi:hypothetical protein FISHEDRAFT_68955 [Fistulina hepatica ATCC 64428]|uniref:F-box domain-containing protein n=1 Tax=Fistulina hepatica ATCC 64428 TaxID=1128425 RepID=A0A0D7APV8_9AGAR|nr:hypothetical protein FISHEDRAFT_68955 [Fistulina hepatica ATCC 64428]
MSITEISFDVLARLDAAIQSSFGEQRRKQADRLALASSCRHLRGLYMPLIFGSVTCKMDMSTRLSNDAFEEFCIRPPRCVDSSPVFVYPHIYQHVRVLILPFFSAGQVKTIWNLPDISRWFRNAIPNMHRLNEITLRNSTAGMWPELASVLLRAPSLKILRLDNVRWPVRKAYEPAQIRALPHSFDILICRHPLYFRQSRTINLRTHDENVQESLYLTHLARSQAENLTRLELPSESLSSSRLQCTHFPRLTHLHLFGVGFLEPLRLPKLLRAIPSLSNLHIEILLSQPSTFLLTREEAASAETTASFCHLKALSLVNCHPDDPIFRFLPPSLSSLTILADPSIPLTLWRVLKFPEPPLTEGGWLHFEGDFWTPLQLIRIFGHQYLPNVEYLRLGVTGDISVSAMRIVVSCFPSLQRLDFHFGPWSQSSLPVSLPHVVETLSEALASSNIHYICLDAKWERDRQILPDHASTTDLIFQKRLFDKWASFATNLSTRIPSLWRVAFAFLLGRRVDDGIVFGRWQVFHVRPESFAHPTLTQMNPETFLFASTSSAPRYAMTNTLESLIRRLYYYNYSVTYSSDAPTEGPRQTPERRAWRCELDNKKGFNRGPQIKPGLP